VTRASSPRQGKSFITAEVLVSERPHEVQDRAVPRHRERDLNLGLRSSAIGTLIERTTRFTMLLRLSPMAGHSMAPGEKNGPGLAGRGAEAVRNVISRTVTNLRGNCGAR
jgi:hypothetical protein